MLWVDDPHEDKRCVSSSSANPEPRSVPPTWRSAIGLRSLNIQFDVVHFWWAPMMCYALTVHSSALMGKTGTTQVITTIGRKNRHQTGSTGRWRFRTMRGAFHLGYKVRRGLQNWARNSHQLLLECPGVTKATKTSLPIDFNIANFFKYWFKNHIKGARGCTKKVRWKEKGFHVSSRDIKGLPLYHRAEWYNHSVHPQSIFTKIKTSVRVSNLPV